jgi:hypothetical protein
MLLHPGSPGDDALTLMASDVEHGSRPEQAQDEPEHLNKRRGDGSFRGDRSWDDDKH